jgi:hypothetical protein
MNKLIFIALTVISLTVMSHPMQNEATLVSEVVENGVLTKTYVMESFSDEYQFCYQLIVVKYDEKTGQLISSDSSEKCNRIR